MSFEPFSDVRVWVFTLVFLTLMLLANELGFLVGHRSRARGDESTHTWIAAAETAILGVLGLIDVTLVANLILIVVFSGYENFVSRIDTSGNPSWPVWITKIDFAGLKQKMLASIVAISAIHVLEAFLNIDSNFDAVRMTWLVAVHLVFVISALLLALPDRWSADKGE